ncbi:bacterio-opsin activator domain-containing protein [Natronomonas marina]|jgi:PAS domain S-box-containing protein|uniref:bacterio-opsin activator domain-containing protein n=1 Tax=Natronomonas marina TaxID=2961939 RepID=UPI0020C96C2E|nr:bacterio-opsin activator domain-containing protein [Natronomonas marina]
MSDGVGRAVEVLLLARESDDGDVGEMLREAVAPPALAAKTAGAVRDGDRTGAGDVALSREADLENALDRVEAESPDVVLLDLDCYGRRGMDLLTTLLDESRAPPIVVLTELDDRERGIEAVRHGAAEYLVTDEATPQLLVRSVYHAVERARHERQRERYETLVRESTDAIAIMSPDGTVEYITPSVRHVVGYEPEDLVGENGFEYVHPADHAAAAEEFQAMVEHPGYRGSVEFRFEHSDGRWITLHARGRNLLDDPAIEGLVVYTHDITERREYERRLESREACLRRTTEILADRERSLDEQIDAVLEVGREMLDVEYGTLSRLREDNYVFETVSGVDDAVQSGDVVPLSATNCERTVSREERLVLEDIEREAPELAGREGNRELGVNCYLGTPITVDGEVVGTFCFYGTDAGEGFSEWHETYIDLVGEWIGSELESRQTTERLAVLNQLNGVVHDVTEAVISRSTRAEIEQTACRRLAESDSYEFAWIGETDAPSREVVARTEAGVEGFLEEVTISTDPEEAEGVDPTRRALKTGEMQMVRDVLSDPRHEPWREAAETHGFRSVAAIPIRHEETVYGVLNVYADRADAFGDAERTVIEHLGEIIGHAIAAAQRKQALVSDAVVELELEVPDAFEGVEAIADMEATIRVDRMLSVSETDYLVYGTTSDAGIDHLEAAVSAVDAWEELSVVGETADGVSFELRLSEPPVLSTVASLGGAIERSVVENGDYRLTAQFPRGTDVRQVVDTLESAFSRVDVVARRQVTRAEGDADRLARAWHERLTDRQRTAVEAAYYSGFFEWPRETSGEAVADSLDITPPTFHQHLRTAEGKLLATLLEGGRDGTGG